MTWQVDARCTTRHALPRLILLVSIAQLYHATPELHSATQPSSCLFVSLKTADIPVFPQLHRLLTGRYTASSRLHLTALPGCVLDSCPDVIAHELQTPKCGHSATTTTTRPLHAVLGMRSAHRTSPNSCTSPVSTSNRPLPATIAPAM